MHNLAPRSGLEHLISAARPANGPAFSMALREGLALANVLVRKDRNEEFTQRVRSAFALEPASDARRVGNGTISFAGAGPGHWLAMIENTPGHTFETQLRNELAGVAYVSDQSDGRTVIRVSGGRARDVLAKGAPIDLHPRAFAVTDSAVTVISHIGVHLWQVDESPTYELAIFRSYSAAFWRWLLQASAEFRA